MIECCRKGYRDGKTHRQKKNMRSNQICSIILRLVWPLHIFFHTRTHKSNDDFNHDIDECKFSQAIWQKWWTLCIFAEDNLTGWALYLSRMKEFLILNKCYDTLRLDSITFMNFWTSIAWFFHSLPMDRITEGSIQITEGSIFSAAMPLQRRFPILSLFCWRTWTTFFLLQVDKRKLTTKTQDQSL